MKECCRSEKNWESKGGKSVFDYDSAHYVKKITKTYVVCRECGSPLLMETTRMITERLVEKKRQARPGKKVHAARAKTVPG